MKFRLAYPKKINKDTGIYGYSIKNNQEVKFSSLYLDHHDRGRRFKIGLGIKCRVDNWDDDKQKATTAKGYQLDSILINDSLEKVVNAFITYQTECRKNEKSLLTNELKKRIELKLSGIAPIIEEPEVKKTFEQLFIEFIRFRKAEDALQTNITRRGILKAVQSFNLKNEPITLENISKAKIQQFVAFHRQPQTIVVNGKRREKPPRTFSTIDKYIRGIKTFLVYIDDKDIEVNQDFKKRNFSNISKQVAREQIAKEENNPDIYLTNNEINQLATIDLSNKPKGLQTALYTFLISCHTGLRFSDIIRLTPSHIIDNGRKQIKIHQKKTGRIVVIPVKQCITHIIDRLPLPYISNPAANRDIKIVAGLAELEKAEKITLHTGRRSFCTNAFHSGIPTITIMKISGHATQKSFLKYIKTTEEETATKLGDHPFMQ